jgi:hypothetical protein
MEWRKKGVGKGGRTAEKDDERKEGRKEIRKAGGDGRQEVKKWW